jgi:hypothetical protein
MSSAESAADLTAEYAERRGEKTQAKDGTQIKHGFRN